MPKWFACPDTSFPPDTEIQLGQIIPDPRYPFEKYGDGPLPFGPNDKVYRNLGIKSRNVTVTSGRTTSVGITAAVFNLLQCGASGHVSSDGEHDYDIGKIESQTLVPSEDYVRQSVLQSAVLSKLAQKNYRKAVFMIVGIQIAQRGDVKHKQTSASSGKVKSGASLTAAGIPVEVGVSVSHGGHGKGIDNYTIEDPFVFAYRLRECFYRIKPVIVEHSVYEKRAALHGITEDRSAELGPTLEMKYAGRPEELEVFGLRLPDIDEECGLITNEVTVIEVEYEDKGSDSYIVACGDGTGD
jgi:hypothetical protein